MSKQSTKCGTQKRTAFCSVVAFFSIAVTTVAITHMSSLVFVFPGCIAVGKRQIICVLQIDVMAKLEGEEGKCQSRWDSVSQHEMRKNLNQKITSNRIKVCKYSATHSEYVCVQCKSTYLMYESTQRLQNNIRGNTRNKHMLLIRQGEERDSSHTGILVHVHEIIEAKKHCRQYTSPLTRHQSSLYTDNQWKLGPLLYE